MDVMVEQFIEQHDEICKYLEYLIMCYTLSNNTNDKKILLRKMMILDELRLKLSALYAGILLS